MKTKKILMPLPRNDFDPTEAGVSWKLIKENKIEIVFATIDGSVASGDQRMISGDGLGVWANLLRANSDGKKAYEEMCCSDEFQNPIAFDKINCDEYDGIVLSGGHACGMKEYLESSLLQKKVTEFFEQKKLVGAICHGTVLAARSLKTDGKSILFGRKTTALLHYQEMTAWLMTCLWLKNYYRTYPLSVQKEVSEVLKTPGDFIPGPIPMMRDSLTHLGRGFVVEDDNYISSRWPGDAHRFALACVNFLNR